MHSIQILSLIAATITTLTALPLQEKQQQSVPLGKRFNYITYDPSEDSTSAAADDFPFFYKIHPGRVNDHSVGPFNYLTYDGKSGSNLGKRFYYTRYFDDQDVDSEDYDNNKGLAKRFYYTHYIDDDAVAEYPELQNPPPFGYDKYGGGGSGSHAKRFYYTDYVQSNTDSESSMQEPPPFGYDKYGGGGSGSHAKRFYYTDYVQSNTDSESSMQEPPPFGYDKYGGGSNGLAKRFYYTRYVDGESVDDDEQDYHGGLAKRFYYTRYVDNDAITESSELQEPPPFGYDKYGGGRESNIVSHEGKTAFNNDHHHSSGSGASSKHGKAHHGHGQAQAHHGKSAWASFKEMLHLN